MSEQPSMLTHVLLPLLGVCLVSCCINAGISSVLFKPSTTSKADSNGVISCVVNSSMQNTVISAGLQAFCAFILYFLIVHFVIAKPQE